MTPATKLLLAVGPFWCLLGAIVAGFLGVGYVLMALGTVQLGICVASSVSHHRPPRLHVIKEDEIGTYRRNGRLVLRREVYLEQRAWRAAQRRAA